MAAKVTKGKIGGEVDTYFHSKVYDLFLAENFHKYYL